MKRYLILEDGTVYTGEGFGAIKTTLGEVVFTTGMVGYQEAITDQSFAHQILVFTNPLIGNYGINSEDNETLHPQIKGVVCHHVARVPSNWRMTDSLPNFLAKHQIPGLQGIDTRELVRKLRQYGTLRGIMTDNITDVKDKLEQLKQTSPTHNIISKVSTKESYANPGTKRTVVVLDFGMKNSILRELNKRDCNAIVLPYNASISEIMAFNPDGILLSNGPGDPLEMTNAAATVAELEKHLPIFGICMGHQIFALANGAKTYKMKFGHRGFNHPVRNLQTGKIAFTSQNHGFAVDPSSIDDTDLQITHLEVNDGTVEGLQHSKYPAFSVQFHPDAAPGPHDAEQLFDKFMALIDSNKEVLAYA
ncbi:glutamine-hydrolyzing carbamoyl-phosphate synthase small subunit [Lactobacillus reuteri]|uniref:glutamine-hydrolyzing carbamoyl-phosphate synthase small subunit n=1 Tax=Limosilactobacillus reuteri TaxID=1598 RepID=UPI00146EBA5D|nr:glutamine-hydrolyzing carbamoyl-phosphate synthase small subunit [Limosilactobacillus reuteri]NMV53138.1 glutamine-hydrolyzing carbamoyl-phosphate synthase small subunit [Limosilactobacillus reuteri]NMV56942.1 glutamine-hydrolyzing carbamoyl-phosphate synthase small subunit [Limosilactobacillus reuteri]NMV65172.1 glutamine-hydrolyzing carbamoyl-phosphate synthase small subunit [Limosilactobacillus reuteri]